MLFDSEDSTSEYDDDGESSFSDLDMTYDDERMTDESQTDSSMSFAWSDVERNQIMHLPFTKSPGLPIAITDTSDLLEYFNLFIIDGMISMIVTETNRRVCQLIEGSTLKRRSSLNQWIDVTSDEMKVSFAVFIYQGIFQKPEVELYWSTKQLLETPCIRQIMTEMHFTLLSKYLHFVDNSSLPETTSASEKSFWKIKNFFDALIERFSTVYVPEQHVATDESLML
ncbi:piggyBac transposable element-derived protein 4-like [Limulus polyphemus]|uniref:PiggyBac transposable element-derived protein 4-like n=1 Tax=Limulus polyphemus TaxID=6850 RepID=A0ABM1BE61_LIMPO|nr:piggyBac transposable element-derived protein 4-like [Limulus polyphemus]